MTKSIIVYALEGIKDETKSLHLLARNAQGAIHHSHTLGELGLEEPDFGQIALRLKKRLCRREGIKLTADTTVQDILDLSQGRHVFE